MTHLKRNKIPKTWPLPRKGTKYVVGIRHDMKKAVPLLVALRDMLKLASNRKEAKKILYEGKIKINLKTAKNEKFPLTLFNVLTIGEKNYKMIIKNKKFAFEETKKPEKIAKIIGKKLLRGKKLQVNLNDGRNFISKEKANVGDSALIDFESKKIKIIPLKEKSKVIFISGKHFGEEGRVEKISPLIIDVNEKKVNANIKNLMVLGES